jgi:hypothetical protein
MFHVEHCQINDPLSGNQAGFECSTWNIPKIEYKRLGVETSYSVPRGTPKRMKGQCHKH